MNILFTNPLFAITILGVLTLIFIFIFTKATPLNKIQLKKLDYVWLSLSAFAIFGLVERNRLELNEIELRKSGWYHEARINELYYTTDTSDFCFKYTKDVNSPPNFDQLQNMEDSLCAWTKNFNIIIREKVKNNDSIKVSVPDFDNAFLKQQASALERVIKEYNKSLGEFLTYKREANVGDFTFIIQLLSPLLLIVGLAIRFSKTAAEIKLDEKTPTNSTFALCGFCWSSLRAVTIGREATLAIYFARR